MVRDYFWLDEEQFSRLEPLLPSDTRGVPRVDDRRVISGTVHVLKSGGRTTKIHALTDRRCRLIAFLLTGGQVADCTAAE